jgi:hypothetical protein
MIHIIIHMSWMVNQKLFYKCFHPFPAFHYLC